MKKRLNIIGCGNLAKTLAHLWAKQGVFEIGDILNRSEKSATTAVKFIGAGQVASSIDNLHHADVYLIATPDTHIVEMCHSLATSGTLQTGDIVFHCSGALSSSELNAAVQKGAMLASIHPVKSFADPEMAISTFKGTFCGEEGNEQALSVLRPAFKAIGGLTFSLDPDHKTIYHAASVIVCNYLTALLEVGIQTYAKAGIDRDTAMKIMQPIVTGTVDNVFKLGTTQALTGPIARGDASTVEHHLKSLSEWNNEVADIYRNLGCVTLDLSQKQGNASEDSLLALKKLLEH